MGLFCAAFRRDSGSCAAGKSQNNQRRKQRAYHFVSKKDDVQINTAKYSPSLSQLSCRTLEKIPVARQPQLQPAIPKSNAESQEKLAAWSGLKLSQEVPAETANCIYWLTKIPAFLSHSVYWPPLDLSGLVLSGCQEIYEPQWFHGTFFFLLLCLPTWFFWVHEKRFHMFCCQRPPI
jgi:hypothetical protein